MNQRKVGDSIAFRITGTIRTGVILDIDTWEFAIPTRLALPYLVETSDGATYWVGEQMIVAESEA